MIRLLRIICQSGLDPSLFYEIKQTMAPEQIYVIGGRDFVRHILDSGDEVGPDSHVEEEEYIVVANGKFSLRIGRGTEKTYQLRNALNIIHIPAGQEHYFRASSSLDYIVVKLSKSRILLSALHRVLWKKRE